MKPVSQANGAASVPPTTTLAGPIPPCTTPWPWAWARADAVCAPISATASDDQRARSRDRVETTSLDALQHEGGLGVLGEAVDVEDLEQVGVVEPGQASHLLDAQHEVLAAHRWQRDHGHLAAEDGVDAPCGGVHGPGRRVGILVHHAPPTAPSIRPVYARTGGTRYRPRERCVDRPSGGDPLVEP